MGSYSRAVQPHTLSSTLQTGFRACKNWGILPQQVFLASVTVMGTTDSLQLSFSSYEVLLGSSQSQWRKNVAEAGCFVLLAMVLSCTSTFYGDFAVPLVLFNRFFSHLLKIQLFIHCFVPFMGKGMSARQLFSYLADIILLNVYLKKEKINKGCGKINELRIHFKKPEKKDTRVNKENRQEKSINKRAKINKEKRSKRHCKQRIKTNDKLENIWNSCYKRFYWQSEKCKLKQKIKLVFHIFRIDKILKVPQ